MSIGTWNVSHDPYPKTWIYTVSDSEADRQPKMLITSYPALGAMKSKSSYILMDNKLRDVKDETAKGREQPDLLHGACEFKITEMW